MKTSERGIDLIKEFEGLYLNAYLCPAKVWTIGYGHTRTAMPGQSISEARARELLREDLAEFERAVGNQVVAPLNQNQFDALVSFAFNLGAGNLARSTLLRRVNMRDYAGAAGEFARWNKAGGKVLNGLTRRRAAEAALFSAAP